METVHVVCVLLSLLCALTTALPQESPRAGLEPYSFEDIFNSSLRPRGFSARWASGQDMFYYRDVDDGNVYLYNALEDTKEILVKSSDFVEAGSSSTYFMSQDLTHVLFAYDTEPLWRHSFSAKYKILELNTSTWYDFPEGALANSTLDYAQWAPSGLSLSFVHKHDLYYQANPSTDAVALTSDGDEMNIFNGVPDWLYEEDVLSDRVSHYWSPDNKYICYARLDDTLVPSISWPLYGDKSNVFGFTREIKYPKAGDVDADTGEAGPNTLVELFIVDVTTPTNKVKLLPPTELANVHHYYLQVSWANRSSVHVVWANRVQNHSSSAYYDATSATPLPLTGLVYNVSGGWVEVPPPSPWFLEADKYITIHPRPVDTSGNWRHLAIVTLGSPDVEFLTNGTEEIDAIYGYDEVNQLIYYSSTNGDSTERHIKMLRLSDLSVECLTCNYPPDCRYITSSFSTSALHYFVNCRGPEIPTYTLRSRVDLNKNRVLESNSQVKAALAQKALPTREFVNIAIGGGYLGVAEIFTPPDHVQGNKYPLFLYAYAGPGSQRVMKTFPIGSSTNNWLTYLKSSHKIAVASVDSRGASVRGDKFKFEMYRKLGTVEVQDQISAGRHFDSLPLIDNARPKAIFGWSYGGGTAAHVIGDPTRVFTCGISVAPVTTKAYYDTAYTERYLALATADDDAQGYDNTDVMNKVNNFKNKTYMIAHGMADDNVHYMHATQLIKYLEDADIMFRQNAYIDQNHGISAPGQSKHLYHSMTEFLLNDCWGGTLNLPINPPVQSTATMASPFSKVTALVVSLITFLFQAGQRI